MKNKLSQRLASLIKENNLSKRALARELNISAMSISDWTNDKVQPTAENIYLIANYFEVSFDYLLGIDDKYE